MDCKAGTPAQEASASLQMPDKQSGQAGANHLRCRTILTKPHIATRPEPCAQIEQPWILRPRQRRHASRSQLGYRQPRKSREGSFRANKEPGAGASPLEPRSIGKSNPCVRREQGIVCGRVSFISLKAKFGSVADGPSSVCFGLKQEASQQWKFGICCTGLPAVGRWYRRLRLVIESSLTLFVASISSFCRCGRGVGRVRSLA
jgi:hypothetical protein